MEDGNCSNGYQTQLKDNGKDGSEKELMSLFQPSILEVIRRKI
jgi:hypothetical protein